jgi:glycosyltransferase involved in cell wall biosynthesis
LPLADNRSANERRRRLGTWPGNATPPGIFHPMPKVTIGVPIYNGADLLRSCLENLVRQTYRDFKVTIFDNRSTDETPQICQEFVDRDPRFSYRLNDVNVGAWPNLVLLAEACDTEYFIWRAYDDYTDDNYIEEMVRLLDATPEAELAVGKMVTLREHRARKQLVTLAPEGRPTGQLARMRLVKHAHPSWLYSLWRTKALQERLHRVMAHHRHAWGGDHVVLFETLYNTRVVGSNRSAFYQRLTERDYKAPREDLAAKYASLTANRASAMRYLREQADIAPASWLDRMVLSHLLSWFADNRIYSRKKLRRLKAKAG